jgi:hypothetical protein
MRILKGISGLFLSIFLCGVIYADVIIDSQIIPGIDISSIIVGPDSGDIFITTKEGYTVQPGGVNPPPSDASIGTFNASPTTITEGESVDIAWASQNTNSCTAIGGAGSWAASSVALSGNKTVTIAEPGSYLFTLECTGDSGTDQKQLSVQVDAIVITPTGNCDAPSLSGQTVEWATIWNGTAFPNPISSNEFINIPRKGYLAIKFNTANYSDTGLLTSIETTATSGRRLGAISQCPGDFEVEESKCRHIWGVGGEIYWSTEGYSKACILEPNTTYYMNLTFTDGIDPESSECENTNCVTKLRTYNP